jgi:hypothetical protein
MIDFSLSNKLTDSHIISNNLLCVLQQIDLLFNTNPDDVLGDSLFGTNYDKYLYSVGISNVTLENKILNDLNNLNLCGYTPSVKVHIVEGTIRDIAIINITLSGNYDTHEKTYIIK